MKKKKKGRKKKEGKKKEKKRKEFETIIFFRILLLIEIVFLVFLISSPEKDIFDFSVEISRMWSRIGCDWNSVCMHINRKVEDGE